MKTTLNAIRAHSPCADGWEKLLRHLGKTQADDEPIAITTILDSNSIEDALWCLRSVEGHQREMRLYAVWCARQVQHLITDPRSIAAIDVAERFANGDATDVELDAAGAAAWDAVLAAAWAAAWDAARTAELEAARTAARTVARTAAMAAARAAARAASRAASKVAAKAAAWAAAWAAAAAQSDELRRVCECVETGIDPYPRAALGEQE